MHALAIFGSSQMCKLKFNNFENHFASPGLMLPPTYRFLQVLIIQVAIWLIFYFGLTMSTVSRLGNS